MQAKIHLAYLPFNSSWQLPMPECMGAVPGSCLLQDPDLLMEWIWHQLISWWNTWKWVWQSNNPINNGSCIHKVPRWFPSKSLEKVPFLPHTPVPARPLASQSYLGFKYQQKKNINMLWCKKVMDSLMPFHFCLRALLAPPVTRRVHSKKILPALFGEGHRRFQHEKKEPIFLHLQPCFGPDFWAVWTKMDGIRE